MDATWPGDRVRHHAEDGGSEPGLQQGVTPSVARRRRLDEEEQRAAAPAPGGLAPGAGASGAAKFVLDMRADSTDASLTLLTQLAASRLANATGHAMDCTVSFPNPYQRPLLLGTSHRALCAAQADQDTEDGAAPQALAGKLTILGQHHAASPRWSAHWHSFAEAGYRSVLSTPLLLGADRTAALTFLCALDNVFTPAAVLAVDDFVLAAGNGFQLADQLRAARSVAEQLSSVLARRTSIDVACGVIMGRNRCSYEEATRILARASQQGGSRMHVTAEAILARAPGGAPGTHFRQQTNQHAAPEQSQEQT